MRCTLLPGDSRESTQTVEEGPESVRPHSATGEALESEVNPNSGLPNPLQWAVISREYEDELYLAAFVGAEGSLWAAGPNRQAARLQGSLP